jgi:peptidoglycan/LPS O-acetylase OafA/YrhL
MLGPLRNYGRYSYCIYVIHLLVIHHVMLVSHRLRFESHVPRFIAFISGVLAGNAAVCWLASLSWRSYEAPILRPKGRFAASPKSSWAAASAVPETALAD